MEAKPEKKKSGLRGALSCLYLLAAAAALALTIRCCCPQVYGKIRQALGTEKDGRSAQAFSTLTRQLEEGEIREAFVQSYRVLRGDEA